MGKITQQSIINPPETILVDPDIHQVSDTETIDYTEDDWIGHMLTQTTEHPIPQDVLYSLARIDSTPSHLLKMMNYYLK